MMLAQAGRNRTQPVTARNFVREMPVPDIVRFQTLAILHKDYFEDQCHITIIRQKANPSDGFAQARNQLGTPGLAKSFLRGAQIFQTMSNSFQLCPKCFSRVQKRFAGGGFAPLPHWLRACGQ